VAPSHELSAFAEFFATQAPLHVFLPSSSSLTNLTNQKFLDSVVS
jgi:hypothetical protein